MLKWISFCFLAVATLLTGSPLFSASVAPLSHDERAERAGAICRGTVEAVVSFRGNDGLIYTEATIRTEETFKGEFPGRFVFRYRGGLVEGEGETVGAMPELEVRDERLFFLTLRENGRLAVKGGPEGASQVEKDDGQIAPTSQGGNGLRRMRQLFPRAAEGISLEKFKADEERSSLLEEAGGTATAVSATGLFSPPRRHTFADRGEPIPYLVDADALPAGISEADALQAVETALAAWSDVSSVAFTFEGIQSFGGAASDVTEADGRIRIQLHDTYGAIGDSSVLGIGGQGYTWMSEFQDGGTGGGVNGLEFHRTTRGSVVLNHTASSMQDLKTFEATLCHELGHALGLAHSSEDSEETDPYLKEAIMYYRIHGDGRGATLGDWDEDIIETVHPEQTPPPFGYDRVLRAVTSHVPLANPEVNEVELRGYSQHAEALSVDLLFPTTNNGSFDLDGSVLTYTPNGAFSDSEELDPAGGQSFDRTYARFSDGINLSPPVRLRVIQFLLDTEPAGAPDGLPDSWMMQHFGSATPDAGFSGAHDDADGDGFTNLQEFLLGTDPRNANSRFAVSEITSGSIGFPARPYEVYELYESVDLENWERVKNPVKPTSTTGEFDSLPFEGSSRFYRVERVR